MRKLVDIVDFREPIRTVEDLALVEQALKLHQEQGNIQKTDLILTSTTTGKAYLYKEAPNGACSTQE